MFWNDTVVFDEERERYAIREAYYLERSAVTGLTNEPIAASGETLDEVREELEWMFRALQQPVIRPSDLSEKI
ncbi:hypothetical protein [Deinococcus sp.]|uniref:hypothetical protein n=1 Tax=Deinococcus sp. TaxID=47478 RepID=UPI003CC640BF